MYGYKPFHHILDMLLDSFLLLPDPFYGPE